jgi:hypothetical protein
MGHTLGGNRHGLIVAGTEAKDMAERAAALDMLDELKATHGMRPATLGADKEVRRRRVFPGLRVAADRAARAVGEGAAPPRRGAVP